MQNNQKKTRTRKKGARSYMKRASEETFLPAANGVKIPRTDQPDATTEHYDEEVRRLGIQGCGKGG